MKQDIINRISAEHPWREKLQCFSSVGSTNDQLKLMARQGASHGTVVLSRHQTGGHGRMGRSFHSPDGMGIYMSLLLRPDCPPTELMHLTCAAAVAVCEALESICGFSPGIKWTNDIVHNKKKLGGILTELGLSAKGTVDYAIIGIGLNCCQQPEDFPADIQHIATSLSIASRRNISPIPVAAALLNSLCRMDESLLTEKVAILEAYRSRCITLGQEISILQGNSIRYGKALSVDDQGALVVLRADGETEAVNSGEVSIRGMYGYV